MVAKYVEHHTIWAQCCEDSIRTSDLQVMSLASYQLLHSAMLYFMCNRFYFPFAIAKLRTIAGVCKHSCCFFAFFLSFPCNNDTYSLQTQGKSTVSACIFAFHELRCRRPISPYFYGRFERAAAADNGKVRDKRWKIPPHIAVQGEIVYQMLNG